MVTCDRFGNSSSGVGNSGEVSGVMCMMPLESVYFYFFEHIIVYYYRKLSYLI